MSVKIHQAFVKKFIDSNFGLPIAFENIDYTPSPGTAYAEIKTIENDITMLSLSDINITDGVFQVVLRYPVGQSSIAAQTKADEIFAVFDLGSLVTFGGQSATITRHRKQPGVAESGWFVLVLTLDYRAKLVRN